MNTYRTGTPDLTDLSFAIIRGRRRPAEFQVPHLSTLLGREC